MKADQSFSPAGQAAMLEHLNRCREVRAMLIPPPPPRPAPRLTFAVTDVHSLPSDYVTIRPDTAALQALADNWHEGETVPYLPGVRFTILPSPTMKKSEKNDTPPALSEQLCAAFILDTPIPIRKLFGLWGQRSTFASWKAKGLDVKTVPGMGPTVRPSDFKRFLLEQRGDYAPRIQ